MLPKKGVPSLKLSSEQVMSGFMQLMDWKRVPQARSSGCKSSVAITAAAGVFAAPRKSKRQLTAESAECCRTRDGSCRPSREAPARTVTGEPDMPLWTRRALGWAANKVRVISARYDHCVACQWSVVQWHSAQTEACADRVPGVEHMYGTPNVDLCCKQTFAMGKRFASFIAVWRMQATGKWNFEDNLLNVNISMTVGQVFTKIYIF